MTASVPLSQLVTLNSWPEHFVPICLDGRINKPFPFVLDVAHVVDYSALQYYHAPTLLPPLTSAAGSITASPDETQRKGAQRKRGSVAFTDTAVALEPDSADRESLRRMSDPTLSIPKPLLSSPIRTSVAVPQTSSSSPLTSATASPLKFEGDRFEFNTQPVGTVLIVGATLVEPSSEDARRVTLSDDEKYYVLRVPNQRIILKPQSPLQQRSMVDHLTQWLRVANQQMLNNRLMFLRAEFAAVPLQPQHVQSSAALSSDADEVARQIHAQQANKEDQEFCSHLASAVFAFGAFVNAREATNHKAVPEDTIQRQVSLGGGTSNANAVDVSSTFHRKYVTLIVPFTFGSLEKIAVAVRHDVFGWYIPLHHRAGVTVTQLLAQHDVSKAPYTLELTPTNHAPAAAVHAAGSSSRYAVGGGGGAARHPPNPRVRVYCKISWASEENWTLKLSLRATGLIRRDFSLCDPACFISSRSEPGPADGSTPAKGDGKDGDGSNGFSSYKVVTEAYRNKMDVDFSPVMLALPTEVPRVLHASQVVDFANATSGEQPAAAASAAVGAAPPSSTQAPAGGGGSGAASAAAAAAAVVSATPLAKPPLLRSKLFPPNVLPPVPDTVPGTIAEIRAFKESQQSGHTMSIYTNHRYGDNILFPCVQPTETLQVDVVDVGLDVAKQDILPSLIGTASVPVKQLMESAGEAAATEGTTGGSGAQQAASAAVQRPSTRRPSTVGGAASGGGGGSPAAGTGIRLSLATGLPGTVNVTPSTPASTVDRLRAKQKRRYPFSLCRFVFQTASEMTSAENSQFLSKAGVTRSPEVSIVSTTKQLRPSFLNYFHGSQWDFSSIFVVDCTSSALHSHFNSFLPNDMGEHETSSTSATANMASSPFFGAGSAVAGGGSSSKGKNVYETVMVAVNRLLMPLLTRGGSDVFVLASNSDGSAALTLVHDYPDGYGTRVDETSAVERRNKGLAFGESAAAAAAKVSAVSFAAIPESGPGSPRSRVASMASSTQVPLLSAMASEGQLLEPAGPCDVSAAEASDTKLDLAVPQTGTQAASERQMFSVLRDWGGEGGIPAYRERLEACVVRARQAAGMTSDTAEFLDRALAEIQKNDGLGDSGSPRKAVTSRTVLLPPPPQQCSRTPILLSTVLKRVMARCAALTNARRTTCARARSSTSSAPAQQVYHIVTIMIHSDVDDVPEAAALLSSMISKPILFLLVFMDDPAPAAFCGLTNCITLDMVCCSSVQQQEQQRGRALADGFLMKPSLTGGPTAEEDGGGTTKRKSVAPPKEVCHSLVNFCVPLKSVHKQLHHIETAVANIPLAFLGFARVSGIAVLPAGDEKGKNPASADSINANRARGSGNADAEGAQACGRHTEANTVANSTLEPDTLAAEEHARQVAQFDSARDRFLVAFGFVKPPSKKPPTAPLGLQRRSSDGGGAAASAAPLSGFGAALTSRRSSRRSLTDGSPQRASIIATAEDARSHHGSSRRMSVGSEVSKGHGDLQLGNAEGTALVAVSSDLRSASVALVDVYMDDDRIREWEVDPQKLRQKMQVTATLQRNATSAGASAPSPSQSSPNATGPLIDDSLIRLHLNRIHALGEVPLGQQSPDPESDDMEDEAAVGSPVDPGVPVRVFSRHTKHDGHMRQVNVRVGGMESFTSKIPAPPSSGGRRGSVGANARERRKSDVRIESPDEFTQPPPPVEEGKPLTARQMAAKREHDDIQRSVDKALKKFLIKSGQHLLKPHIHSRLLESNAQQQRRRSQLAGSFDDGQEDGGGAEESGAWALRSPAKESTGRGGGTAAHPPQTAGSATIPEKSRPFQAYLGHELSYGQSEHMWRRLDDAYFHQSLARPPTSARISSAGSSRSSASAPAGPLANHRPASASSSRTQLASRPSSAGVKKQRDQDGTDGSDEVRVQQLAPEKRAKLQLLLSADTKSYGGPKLNEEMVYEQEAEYDKRLQKELRRKQHEQLESALRNQILTEQVEKNRAKIKQFLRQKDDREESEVE